MNRRSACLVAIGLMLFCSRTWAELVVEITKGQADAIPIAIVPFSSPEAAAASFDVAQLVSDDLARSGRFRTTDRKDMIEQPHTGAGISFDDWRRLNNDYMVVGQVQPLGQDSTTFSTVSGCWATKSAPTSPACDSQVTRLPTWCSRRS
jgi:TolB protein